MSGEFNISFRLAVINDQEVQQKFDAAKRKAEELESAVGDVSGPAQQAGKSLEEMGESAESMGRASEGAGDSVDDMGQVVGDAMLDAEHAAEDAADTFTDFEDTAVDAADFTADAFDDMGGVVTDSTDDAITGVEEFGDSVGDMGDAAESAVSDVDSEFSNLPGVVGDAVSDAGDEASDFEDEIDEMSDAASSEVSAVGSEMSNLSGVVSTGISAVDASGFADEIDEMSDAASSEVSAVSSEIGNLPGVVSTGISAVDVSGFSDEIDDLSSDMSTEVSAVGTEAGGLEDAVLAGIDAVDVTSFSDEIDDLSDDMEDEVDDVEFEAEGLEDAINTGIDAVDVTSFSDEIDDLSDDMETEVTAVETEAGGLGSAVDSGIDAVDTSGFESTISDLSDDMESEVGAVGTEAGGLDSAVSGGIDSVDVSGFESEISSLSDDMESEVDAVETEAGGLDSAVNTSISGIDVTGFATEIGSLSDDMETEVTAVETEAGGLKDAVSTGISNVDTSTFTTEIGSLSDDMETEVTAVETEAGGLKDVVSTGISNVDTSTFATEIDSLSDDMDTEVTAVETEAEGLKSAVVTGISSIDTSGFEKEIDSLSDDASDEVDEVQTEMEKLDDAVNEGIDGIDVSGFATAVDGLSDTAQDTASDIETAFGDIEAATTSSLGGAEAAVESFGGSMEGAATGTGPLTESTEDLEGSLIDMGSGAYDAGGQLNTFATAMINARQDIEPGATAADEFNQSIGLTGIAVGVAAGSLIGLATAYDAVRKAEFMADRVTLAHQRSLTTLAQARVTLTNMQEGGKASAEALAAAQQRVADAEEQVGLYAERLEIIQGDLNSTYWSFYAGIGPQVIGVVGGIIMSFSQLAAAQTQIVSIVGHLKQGFSSLVAGLTGSKAALAAVTVSSNLTAASSVRLGGALSTVASTAGGTTVPAMRLTGVLGGLTTASGAAAAAMNATSGAAARKAIMLTAATGSALRLTPALGGVTGASVATALGLTGASGAAFKFGAAIKAAFMAMLASPLAPIILVLTGIGVALAAVAGNWFGFRDAIQSAGEAIGDFLPFLRPVLDGLQWLGESLGLIPKPAEQMATAIDGTEVALADLEETNKTIRDTNIELVGSLDGVVGAFNSSDAALQAAVETYKKDEEAKDKAVAANFELVASVYGLASAVGVSDEALALTAQHIRDNAIAGDDTKTSMDALGDSYFEVGRQLEPLLDQLGVHIDLTKIDEQQGWDTARSKAALVEAYNNQVKATFGAEDALRTEIATLLIAEGRHQDAADAVLLQGDALEELAKELGINSDEIDENTQKIGQYVNSLQEQATALGINTTVTRDNTGEIIAQIQAKEEQARVSGEVAAAYTNLNTEAINNREINQTIIDTVDDVTSAYDYEAIALDAVAKGKLDAANAGIEEYHSLVRTASALGYEGDTRRANIGEMMLYVSEQEKIKQANEEAVATYFDLGDASRSQLEALGLTVGFMGQVADGTADLTEEQRLMVAVMNEVEGATEPNIQLMAELVREGADLEEVVSLTNDELDQMATEMGLVGEETEATTSQIDELRGRLEDMSPAVQNVAEAWGLYDESISFTTEELKRMESAFGDIDSELESTEQALRDLAVANGVDLRESISMTTEEVFDFVMGLDDLNDTQKTTAETAKEAAEQLAEEWKASFENIKQLNENFKNDMVSASGQVWEEMGTEWEAGSRGAMLKVDETLEEGAEQATETVRAGLGFQEDFWADVFPATIARMAWDDSFDAEAAADAMRERIKRATEEGLITEEEAREWFDPMFEVFDQLPDDTEEALGEIAHRVPGVMDDVKSVVIAGMYEIGPEAVAATKTEVVDPIIEGLEGLEEGASGIEFMDEFINNNMEGAIAALAEKSPALAAQFRAIMENSELEVNEKVQHIAALVGEVDGSFEEMIMDVGQTTEGMPRIMNDNIQTPAQEMRQSLVESFREIQMIAGTWTQGMENEFQSLYPTIDNISEKFDDIPEAAETAATDTQTHANALGGMWGLVRPEIESGINGINEVVDEIPGAAEAAATDTQTHVNALGGMWGAARPDVQSGVDSMNEPIEEIPGAAEAAATDTQTHVNALGGMWGLVRPEVQAGVEGIKEPIGEISPEAEAMQTATSGEFTTLQTNVNTQAGIIGTAVGGIVMQFVALKNWIETNLPQIDLSGFATKVTELGTHVQTITTNMSVAWLTHANSVAASINGPYSAAINRYTALQSTLTSFVGAQTTQMSVSWVTHGSSVTSTIGSTISSQITRYTSLINTLAGNVRNQTAQMTTAWNNHGTAVNTATTRITSSANTMASNIQSAGSRVTSTLNSLTSTFADLASRGSSHMNSLASNFSSNMNRIISDANRASNSLRDLQRSIDNLKDKTVTINVNRRESGGGVRAQHGFEGIIAQPTRFLVGEGNKPEYVLVEPLDSGLGGGGMLMGGGAGEKGKGVRAGPGGTGSSVSLLLSSLPKSIAKFLTAAIIKGLREKEKELRTDRAQKAIENAIRAFERLERQTGATRKPWEILDTREKEQIFSGGTFITKGAPGRMSTADFHRTFLDEIPKSQFDLLGLVRPGASSATPFAGRAAHHLKSMESGRISEIKWLESDIKRQHDEAENMRKEEERIMEQLQRELERMIKQEEREMERARKEAEREAKARARELERQKKERERAAVKAARERERAEKAKAKKKKAQFGFRGIVTRPTTLVVGEGDRPEMVQVVPLTGRGGVSTVRQDAEQFTKDVKQFVFSRKSLSGDVSLGGGGNRRTLLSDKVLQIIVPLEVDGRELARAIRKFSLDGLSSMK